MIIAPDKFGHFGIGAIIALSGLWIGPWALIPVGIFAIGKEIWDHAHPPHRAELADVLATMAGGITALLLIACKVQWP